MWRKKYMGIHSLLPWKFNKILGQGLVILLY